MKLDCLQAAKLFLMARGRGGENENEDLMALSTLLNEFAKAGYEKAKEESCQRLMNLQMRGIIIEKET